jgi:GntR family transcriptional regulator/MocR family aminotransferase
LLAPLGVGASGLDIESLSALCARRRVRAVYVTPHHQYPTLATMAAPRRLALLELARRHRFAVIEDDYDHEFHYEGRPVLPLASADAAGVVITVGTLSKIFAPGLRVGWVVAPPPVVGSLARLRSHLDGQGDLPLEAALAELMEDGVVQRHARRARRIYRARRDYLVAALGRRLSDQLAFQVPSGGMALWARVRGVNADAWSEAALARGLSVRSARHFALDGRSRPYLRLGYASLNERELAEAVRRLWVARPTRQR